MGRFDNNLGIMNEDELKIINSTNVLLIGVGGLGGYIANSLARLGVLNLTIVDDDLFAESNLNRQLYCNMKTIGKSKVKITKKELLKINPSMNITIFEKRYNESIDEIVFKDIDIIMEAVDNVESRLLIESDSTKHNIPLIHGAIAGWTGWVGITMPNANIFQDIYKYKKTGKGIEETLKSPTFIPAIIANLMTTEFIKFLVDKNPLTNQILFIDVLEHEYRIIYKK